MSRRFILRSILAFLLSIAFAANVRAGVDPPVLGVLTGNQLAVDSMVTVEDSKFFDPAYAGKLQTGYPVQNKITLKINESLPVHLQSAFTVTVTVQIKWTDVTSTINTVNKTLNISYSPLTTQAYNYLNTYEFMGGYRVEVKITSITLSQPYSWDAKVLVMLVNELQSYPLYNFSCSSDSIAQINHVALPATTSSDHLTVSWDDRIGIDEYDLEWTYIDSSALASGRYDTSQISQADKIFANNASRVTITGTSYNIPLLYDNTGTLFFRVRPVHLEKSNIRFEGNWSSSYGSPGLGRFHFKGHQRNLNWQATTSFAEEGKRKTVVQYFDGSLRNRQTVSKDNTTDTTIIAESFYDYQGRPVIQVLPAPSLSNIIQYTQSFNTGINSNEYDKADFDVLLDSSQYCAVAAPAMDTLSGTSRYYSSNNPDKNRGFHQYIPDAKGFPFTETEYVQDNTGRISRQGGVGEKYRLSSGHETKYFYGTPDQRELDALFGTEVGDQSHYFKTMVRDANGQYSVSYTDMHGRTIATALAGTPPDSIRLDTLSSSIKATRTETLSTPSSTVIRGLVMETKKGLLVSRAGNHTFSYKLHPDSLQIEGCNSSTICYDCLYDLEITITDDCNNQKLGGKAFDTLVRNFSMAVLDTACNTPAGFHFSFVKYLLEGSYEITKKLSVSRQAMDYYRDSIFMLANACKTIDSFINEKRQALLVNSQCQITCASCTDSLGTWDSFKQRFIIQAGIQDGDTATAWQAYQQAVEDCSELCSATSELVDIKKAMLLDLTPPSGQYANVDSLTDRFSIFFSSIDGVSPDTTALYQQISNYVDEEGKPDFVFDEGAGRLVKPNALSPETFASKFKLSWAKALLPYHPEYCKLQKYEALSLSHEWDRRFASVETFQEALAKGYLNPTNSGSAPFTQFDVVGGVKDYDPLATVYDTSTTTSDNHYKDLLESKMLNYVSYSGGSISVWSLATVATKCQSADGSCYSFYSTVANAFNTDSLCTADLDVAWRTFRQMYLDLKRDRIYRRITAQCPHPNAAFLTLFNHQPHFSNAADMLSIHGANLPSDTADARAQVQGQASDYYDANCRAYAKKWAETLAGCSQYPIDSINNVIIPRLIEVCKAGSDASHPLGSSSISPSSSYSYASFQEVIAEYNQSHGITDSLRCHPYVINNPKPYNKQLVYSDKPLLSKPDSCECTTINQKYTEFTQSADSTFSAYMQRRYQTSISDSVLSVLRTLCNDSATTCNFLTAALKLPPVLQCYTTGACISCQEFNQNDALFRRAYPGLTPTVSPGAFDSVQLRTNALYEQFMNHKLGFSKASADYIQFSNDCRGVVDVAACNNLTQIKSDFVQYGGIPRKLDASGADTSRWRINFGGTFTYRVGVPLREVFKNGVLKLPDYYTSTLTKPPYDHVDFDYTRDTLCVDSSGFTFETRLRVPDSVWIPNGFSSLAWIWIWTDNNPTGVVLSSVSNLDGQGVAMCTHANANDPLKQCSNDNVVAQSLNDWTVVKFEFRYRQVQMFVNNVLLAQRNLDHPMMKIYNWSVAPFSYKGEIDYVKIYDTAGRMLYDEEFNDVDDQAYVQSRCTPCEERFKSYYNTTNNTNFSYAQIDSIYTATCNQSLTVCDVDTTVQTSTSGVTLCGRSQPTFGQISLPEVNNCSDSAFFAISTGTELFKAYVDSIKNNFNIAYRAKCLEAYKKETFTVTHEVSEYHYTLYYYDQAGNLVKTIAPEGVVPNHDSVWLDSVRLARIGGLVKVPAHRMPTQYRYNTLNQVVAQKSPDGGKTDFWYDRLGRLAVSQNARQYYNSATENSRLYSYTLYDSLGRITEVGEIKNATTTAMSDSISRQASLLAGWLQNSVLNKSQITSTVYDVPYAGFIGIGSPPVIQHNLRNRVSFTSLTDTLSTANYNSATFYSYDIHGNVDTLLQDYGSSSDALTANMMNSNGNQYKKLVYDYDLISGKVNMMQYQPGYRDMFIHKYTYDAENRLIEVQTSLDSIIWQKDARYEYYKHGPLARVVIGEQLVQGLDYSYTLQGWLKGINATGLNSDHDIGGDGRSSASNQYTGKDAFGINLNYFNGDYTPINAGRNPFPAHWSSAPDSIKRPLYNGNISSIAMSLAALSNTTNYVGGATMLYGYRYDQLNRLTGMDALNGFNQSSNNWSGITALQEFKERVRYDANGNILRYLRNGPYGEMDSLTYKYYAGTNRLSHIDDAVAASTYTGTNRDLDDQHEFTYKYDSIGNLIADEVEALSDIKWNVYGKIREMNRVASGSLPASKVRYMYDAQGNRIGEILEKTGNPSREYTWYVRDGQGNILSIYNAHGGTSLSSLIPNQRVRTVYGSSRLGNHQASVSVDGGPAAIGPLDNFSYTRGQRIYELTNHLGNVVSTVTDRKYAVTVTTSPGSAIAYYDADIFTATDYAPFGMQLLGRTAMVYGAPYRFGFNGKENDDDIKGVGLQQDYGMRIYDPRVGRFLSVDPLTKSYPWNSPYAFAEGDPINFIDLDGLEKGDPPYKNQNVNFVQLFNPLVQGIKRSDAKTFTETVLSFDNAKLIEYTINAQQYERNGIVNPFSAGDNSDWIAQGYTIDRGKVFMGRSSPSTFYFSIKDSKVTFGHGDAPLDANFAVGGGIPMIINGLKYGQNNIYSPDAPAGLPEVGDPGADNRKYLTQRSNAGYPKQDNATVGKSILAYNSKTGAFMLGVQQDNTKGMTLTEIRNHLIALGYDNAISFDGSTSATLVKDKSVLVQPSSTKDNTIPSGVKFKVFKEEKKQ